MQIGFCKTENKSDASLFVWGGGNIETSAKVRPIFLAEVMPFVLVEFWRDRERLSPQPQCLHYKLQK
jgi:hypothetical protein